MKSIFCLFIFSLFLTNLSAQKIRFYVGGNLSNVSHNQPGLSSTAVRPGYQFGADVQVGKKFYFQPGLQYSVTHIGLSQPLSTHPKTDLWVSGVKIPVMFGRKLIIHHSVNLRFFTGPSFMVVTNVAHKNTDDPDFKLTDKNYHDVEWAAHLGAGIDWRHFFFDLGFQKGLTYVFTGGSKARSNQPYLNVGVRF